MRVEAGMLRIVLAIVLVIAAWEAVVRLGVISPIILAGPSDIVAAAFSDGVLFLRAFGITLYEIVVALAVAWTLGVVVGVLVGMSPLSAKAFAPVLSGFFAIPLIIWYPLFVVWFGIGPVSKIIFGIVAGFFPVATSTLAGLHQVEARYVQFGRSIGLPRWQIFFGIVLMLALPSITTGLRIATAVAVASIVFAEMLASLGGVGFWISYNRTIFNTSHVYLGMLLAVFTVFLCNLGLGAIERRLNTWREVPE